MVELNQLAVTQTPLLQNLRASAGGLTTLSRNLPDFNAAATKSLTTPRQGGQGRQAGAEARAPTTSSS